MTVPTPPLALPTAGDTSVVVRDAAPGASIRLFAGPNRDVIGYGPGPTVPLTRPLQAHETVTVAQHVAKCHATNAWQTDVAEVDP